MTCCFLECSLVYPAEEDKDRYAEEPILAYDNEVDYRKFKCTLSVAKMLSLVRRVRRCLFSKGIRRGCRRCCWIMTILILIVTSLTFTVLFVIVPLTFKNSIEVQRSLIFHPGRGPHSAYDGPTIGESNFANIYLTVKDDLKIGLWNVSSSNYWQKGIKPTLIYFHNGVGDRRRLKDFYRTYANPFNVIAFDYRSYGDSSTADLVEDGLVDDAVYLYKWVLNQTEGDVYLWGNRLGAAIAAHTVVRLRNDGILATGLILENPFTSMSEILTTLYWPFVEIFSWLPWYDAYVTRPLSENGLSFNTTRYVTKVDCPILVLSSCYGPCVGLLEKVSAAAADRQPLTQGSVTVNRVYWDSSSTYFDGYSSYNSELNDFIAECNIYKQRRSSTKH